MELLRAVTSEAVMTSAGTRSHYASKEDTYRQDCATALASVATARVEQVIRLQRVKGLAYVTAAEHGVVAELQRLLSQAKKALRVDTDEAEDPSKAPSAVAAIRAALAHLQVVTAQARAALDTTPQGRRKQEEVLRSRAREMQVHSGAAQRASRREFAARRTSEGAGPSASGRKDAVQDAATGVDVEGFSVPAALSEAQAALFEGNAARARQLFARAIRAAPDKCPAAARIGLGVALLRLGHTSVAHSAMRRAVQLDPSNPTALACFAVLDMVQADKYRPDPSDPEAPSKAAVVEGAQRQALLLLERAVEHDPSDPTALLPLAQLVFWSWTPVVAPPPPDAARAGEGGDGAAAVESEPVVARVVHRSRLLWCSAPVAARLHPGQVLLVGDSAVQLAAPPLRHEVLAGEPGMDGYAPGTVLRLAGAYIGPSASAQPLQQRDTERAASLAKAAIRGCADARVRAEAYFVSAKCLHARRRMLDAYVEYRHCTDADAGHLPAVFGRAQFMVSQGRPQDARQLAKQVLARQRDNADALRMLAQIERGEGKYSAAAKLAQRATEVAPSDYEAWLQLAEIAQVQRTRAGLRQAVGAYKRAGKLMSEAVTSAPFELWVNTGALQHTLGAPDAVDLYGAALRTATAEAVPESGDDEEALQEHEARVMFSPKCVTLAFNLALLQEREGDSGEACRIYEGILRRHPAYADAMTRLGAVAASLGQNDRARAWFTRAVEASRGGAQGEDALAALARLHEEEGDIAGAKSRFATVIGARAQQARGASAGRREHYAEVAKANLHFAEIYRDPRASHLAASSDRRDAAMKRAFEGYKTVLKAVPSNVFAANGLGMVLAEQGRLPQALAAFRAAREAKLDALPVTVNLAHVELALGSHTTALQLYRHSLKLCDGARPEQRVRVLVHLARAFCEAEQLPDARRTLQQALALRPDDLSLWFNLTFVMGDEAVRTLDAAPQQRTVKDVERAALFLERCVRRLQWLRGLVNRRDGVIKEADAASAQAKAGADVDPAMDALMAEAELLRAQAARDELTAEKVTSLLELVSQNHSVAPRHLAHQRRMAERKTSAAADAELRRRAVREAKDNADAELQAAAEQQKRRAQEAAVALQQRVAAINETFLASLAKDTDNKKGGRRKGQTGGAEDGDEHGDLSEQQLAAIAQGRRAGDEDDDLEGALDAMEELRRAFQVSTADLFADEPALAADKARAAAVAGDQPFDVDAIFAGLPALPAVGEDAYVGGGYATARSEAATRVAEQLGLGGGTGSDDDGDDADVLAELEAEDEDDYGAADAAKDAPGLSRALEAPAREPRVRRAAAASGQASIAAAVADIDEDDDNDVMAPLRDIELPMVEQAVTQAKRPKQKRRLVRASTDSDGDDGGAAPTTASALFDSESEDESEIIGSDVAEVPGPAAEAVVPETGTILDEEVRTDKRARPAPSAAADGSKRVREAGDE